jgi:hypothetical protein
MHAFTRVLLPIVHLVYLHVFLYRAARLQLDTTDVLVGINLEIGEPTMEAPGHGRVQCSVECTTSASAEFEGRGGQDLNVALVTILTLLTMSATPLLAPT